ncbi:MAG: class I SAM-dependent methyltransferase [Defluviitaleaceae bacterium]|nr:class I SAM-dependent methyltransferase [Defluviitaleaceae bacterium]
MSDYTRINSETIDKWNKEGWIWATPVSTETFAAAKRGVWDVVLSPQIPVPKKWFAPFISKKNNRLDKTKILGLASGGGQQMPIFAASGADCTILDYSKLQLANEEEVAKREGYDINIIHADMTKTLPFPDSNFDLIFHPVSNCYVEDIQHIWRECFRVLRPGGILMAGMVKGMVYLFDDDNPLLVVNKLPYNPLKDKNLYDKAIAENWGIQFSHSLEEQIGGQLEAGFILTDIYEDSDRETGIAEYCPNYLITRAVKGVGGL